MGFDIKRKSFRQLGKFSGNDPLFGGENETGIEEAFHKNGQRLQRACVIVVIAGTFQFSRDIVAPDVDISFVDADGTVVIFIFSAVTAAEEDAFFARGFFVFCDDRDLDPVGTESILQGFSALLCGRFQPRGRIFFGNNDLVTRVDLPCAGTCRQQTESCDKKTLHKNCSVKSCKFLSNSFRTSF